jgi:hypothetical protein
MLLVYRYRVKSLMAQNSQARAVSWSIRIDQDRRGSQVTRCCGLPAAQCSMLSIN